MDNMLDMYLFETNSLLEQLDEILLESEKAKTFTIENVDEIFRIMHTIKGSSAMMEFSSMTTIAHRIEDLFFFIRENGVAYFSELCDEESRHELFDILFHAVDYMRSEVEKIENNEPLDDNIDSFIEDINTYLNKISIVLDKSKIAEAEAELNQKTEEATLEANAASAHKKAAGLPDDDASYYLRVYFDIGCGMENLRAFMLVMAIKDSSDNFKFYPDDVETNSETAAVIVDNGFILSFTDKENLDKAVSVIKNSSNIQTYEIIENLPVAVHKKLESVAQEGSQRTKTTAPAKTAQLVKEPPSAAASVAQPSTHKAQNKQSLISVNLSKLDNLMAIVGEIVITESMVTSSPEIQGVKLDSFTKSARQLRKLTDELQDITMSIRMVPVSGVFQKMNRIVRDMGQKLNKNVKLTIEGEDTEVDKTIVDSIGDPIMHIVRNSMDHGIEDNVEDRINAGKDPQGEIILSAQHTGSEVIISIRDDGSGINPDKIIEKARNNGLLIKPESEYTKREILNLLMLPGFSTNEQVTEFSGRGVGMDVVKKNVENVGGVVTITSDEGKGTCTTLKIPLTLAIVDGMEIAVGKSIFTIPITNIRQSFKVSSEDIIHDANQGEIIKRMDAFYPIIRIHELYNIETEVTNIEDGILVWVESSEKSYCLFVDELLGEQQIVVKPLPVYLNSFNIKNSGIAGCTILGDGNISIILDILNLYTVSNNLF